jgi:hypothetical protein
MVSRLINFASSILQPNIVAYPIAAGSTMRWYMTAAARDVDPE